MDAGFDPTCQAVDVRRDVFLYALLPLCVSLALIFSYFSGIRILQNIVAPAWNREFGLLESLQHLLLLACVVLAMLLAWRERRPGFRIFFGLIGLAALFAFVEEIDYGLHYYEALRKVPLSERAVVRNLHNIRAGSGEEWATYIKRSVDAGMIFFFVLLPFLSPRLRPGRYQQLIPRRPFALLMVLSLALSRLVHHLDDTGWSHNGSLSLTMGEFRELLVYYIGFLYIGGIWLRARAASADGPGAPAERR